LCQIVKRVETKKGGGQVGQRTVGPEFGVEEGWRPKIRLGCWGKGKVLGWRGTSTSTTNKRVVGRGEKKKLQQKGSEGKMGVKKSGGKKIGEGG